MSNDAIILYHEALRVIALAGMYSTEDVVIALGRPRHEQLNAGGEHHRALGLMCEAIEAAAEDEDGTPLSSRATL